MQHFMALDQGTTKTKAVIVNLDGTILSYCERLTPILKNRSEATINPDALIETVEKTLDEALSKANLSPNQIAALGIAAQTESFFLCTDSAYLTPLISWQDKRKPEDFHVPFPVYVGTVDTLLFYHFSQKKRFITDPSQASMIDLSKLKNGQLPQILPSDNEFGFYKGIPILGAIGDQQASLYGENSSSILNLGMRSLLLQKIGSKKQTFDDLVTSIGWQTKVDGIQYMVEASLPTCAPLFNGIKDQLHLVDNFAEMETLAAAVSDTNGLYYHLEKGELKGFSSSTHVAHLLLALLEGFLFSLSEKIELLQKRTGQLIKVLSVGGNVANNHYLLQLLSDLSGIALKKPRFLETSLLGALKLASKKTFAKLAEDEVIFNPRSNPLLLQRKQIWKEIFYEA